MRTQLVLFLAALMFLFGGLMGFMVAFGQDTRTQGGAAGAATGGAGGGDQVVDGISESSLIARYILDGNANDRSRDGHNATVRGNAATFVDDRQFGRVLSLTGEAGVFLELPASTLKNAESLTVVGWVFLGSDANNQTFFDFGQNANVKIFSALTGSNPAEAFRTHITATGPAGEQGPAGPRIPGNRWVHVAAALDATTHTLTTYVDGVRVGQTKDLTTGLDKIIDSKNADNNKLYIGRSQEGGGADSLNARLHDLRLYNVALTDEQVATIRRNALAGVQVVATGPVGGGRRGAAPTSRAAIPVIDFGGPKIVAVPDISVSTSISYLPKLPVTIPATYENGAKGPDVRVIWPAPTTNTAVQKAGTYSIAGIVPGTSLTPKATVTITADPPAPAPTRTLEPFALGQVILNKDLSGRDTQFMKNRDKFVLTLADTNADNFLYMFRNAFGQPQPAGAKALGGWDDQTTRLRGHASGHYLSALAQAYASSSYDPKLQAKFLEKMNYVIDTLYDLSQKSGNPKEPGGPSNADPTAVPTGPGKTNYDSNFTAAGLRTDYWNWGKGFISAYPPDQFIMLEHGASYGGSNAQIWAPYYTLHKILAGLLDCYEVGGNKKALEIASGMGLWAFERLKVIPEANRIAMWNRYIAGEYGGMNEVMARMYRLTKDQRFLEGAKLFDNINFFYGNAQKTAGLADNVDTLRTRHANQHIPQITGALETYRDSSDPVYYRIADNFWDFVNSSYTYSIGGVAGGRSNAECFTTEPDSLWQFGFARGGQNETCATYNMLKLTRQLFMFRPDQAKYMDYYEQALYNDILASVAEDSPGNTYHIPLNPASRKDFGNEDMSGFSCCNGTALESNTKLQDSIYFRSADNGALYVNLYVPSTLNWTERKAVVKQETNFPYADSTRITITGGGGLDIHVRVPDWATKGFFVKIDGAEKQVDAKPGTYLSLGKDWKDGATIELRMPFEFHLMRVMDQPNIASILYGPVVLAAEEPAARSDWHPVTLNIADLSKSITGDPATLRFKIGDVSLKPFYESYGRYSVYFDVKPE